MCPVLQSAVLICLCAEEGVRVAEFLCGVCAEYFVWYARCAVFAMANSRKRPREVENFDEIEEPLSSATCCNKFIACKKRQKKPFFRWELE